MDLLLPSLLPQPPNQGAGGFGQHTIEIDGAS
jgi:hypothetical protein